MFKKKPTIKAFAPLRSSDRRKIADQIIADFGVDVPQPLASDENNGAEPATISIGEVRNALFPENAVAAKFTTTAGPDLKPVSGTIYAGKLPGDDQRILWFNVHDRMIPSLYTLWRNPSLVPILHTPDLVLDKLCHGSPLMTPGLANGPPFPPKATKNAIVAVASLERPTVPYVVGVAELDISGLGSVTGAKGHAVRGEHWYGDELWSWSSTGKPGLPPPESLNLSVEDPRPSDSELKIAQMSLDDDREDGGGVKLNESAISSSDRLPKNQHVEGEDPEKFETVQEHEMTTKEIDEAFWKAFLYAIHQSKAKHRGEKDFGIQFPVRQSNVISHLVNPFLPSYTPKRAAALQIKKTSWKNPKKFIKALDKAQIVKSKDQNGGECVILDIDFDDRAITEFTPYPLPKKETPAKAAAGTMEPGDLAAVSSSSDPSVGQRLQKFQFLRPKDALSPIFQSANSSTGALYLAAELRSIVTAYLESENLISNKNKRLVNLNAVLSDHVFDGSSSLDREVNAKGTVPRDALVDRIQQSCSPFWILLRNDEPREGAKVKAGHGPTITITLETRSGSKTVTRVSGLEAFHINPQLLANELRKTCAGSTSVDRMAGSSPKSPVMEVMVQGPQHLAIMEALEKRGVKKAWVELVDKSKHQVGVRNGAPF